MQRATAAHQEGRYPEAEKAYLEALQLHGKNADALRLLGALYVQMNRSDRAETYLEKAIKLQPQNPELFNNLGLALRNLGRIPDSIRHYEQAVALKPDYVQALNNLGSSYLENGRPEKATDLLERALKCDPRNPQTHYNLGNALRNERPGEAIPHYVAALRLKPDYMDAMINLGLAYIEAGDVPQAVAWYQNSLRVDPRNVRIMNNLGIALRRNGRAEEAHALFERAIATKPDYAEAHVNFATSFRDRGDLAKALEICERALKLNPSMSDAYNNIAALLQDQGKYEEALRACDRALEINPESIDAKWNRALTLLFLGRLEEGWAAYEVGLGHRHLRGPYFAPRKRWDGSAATGKRLLIWGEQGLGDSLQFIRYASMCKERVGKILVLCPDPLKKLFALAPGVDEVAARPREEDYDIHIPVMSLPFAFQTRLETIPANIPYLRVSDEARLKWAPCFAGKKGIKVGLVWAGNPREHLLNAHLIDKRRSMKLESFRPLFDHREITFYSLQKSDASKQIESCGLQERIVDLMPHVEDFMDTAAIVENLDLVISVDTSVVHLAGGMGKPVWILSRFDGCWRWLGNRETSPWYPTARIFSQPTAGDWGPVIEKVAAELAKF